jgi:hypothetical protein
MRKVPKQHKQVKIIWVGSHKKVKEDLNICLFDIIYIVIDK